MDSIKKYSGFVLAADQPKSVTPPKDSPVLPSDRISSIISFKGSFEKRFIRFARELQGDLTCQTKDRSIPKMPTELQLEFVCLLLAHKAESQINDSSITLPDFYSLLTSLEVSQKATPEIKNAIALFRQYDPETFLTEGVELYNRRTECQIKLEVKEEFNCLDRTYEATFNEKLNTDSVGVKVLLSSGMSSRQIFFQYPECREDCFVPDDLKGRNYLKNTFGINGPKTLSLIKKDELSIADATNRIKKAKLEFELPFMTNYLKLTRMENHWGALNLFEQNLEYEQQTPFVLELNFLRQQKENLQSKVVVNYVVDEMLDIKQAVYLLEDQRIFLEMPAIQKSIDNFELTMEQALALPNPKNLNHGLYKYINNGELSPVEATRLTPEKKSLLNTASLQMEVASGEKTLKEALNLVAKVVSQSVENVI